jgi:hypothetical protein
MLTPWRLVRIIALSWLVSVGVFVARTQAADDAPSSLPTPPPASSALSFAPGERMWSVGGSYVAGIEKRADIGALDVAVDAFVFKNFSLGAELTALGASQSGPESFGVSFAVDFRHHLLRWDGGSAYIDGFFGPAEMSARLPAGGTRFNFISRIGPGVMLKVSDASYLMLGARWFHLSNAEIEGAERNPAINGVQAYVAIAHAW